LLKVRLVVLVVALGAAQETVESACRLRATLVGTVLEPQMDLALAVAVQQLLEATRQAPPHLELVALDYQVPSQAHLLHILAVGMGESTTVLGLLMGQTVERTLGLADMVSVMGHQEAVVLVLLF
jgi:hypothetical protein